MQLAGVCRAGGTIGRARSVGMAPAVGGRAQGGRLGGFLFRDMSSLSRRGAWSPGFPRLILALRSRQQPALRQRPVQQAGKRSGQAGELLTGGPESMQLLECRAVAFLLARRQ